MAYKLHVLIICLLLLFTTQGKAAPAHNKDLAAIAFNQNLTVKTRWRALMALAITQEEKSLVHLENAVKSRDWFMRNAGLIAMSQIAPEMALSWARRMIRDPALVVRTTAVIVFQKRGKATDIDLLWSELDNKINFKRGESLWIRHHIVRTLGTLSPPSDISKFIPLLDDADQRVRKASIIALETLTGDKPSYQGQHFTQKVTYWKKYSTLAINQKNLHF